MAITINGTTGISGVDGSAGTPALQGSDPNTGIYSPGADQVAVATNGTGRLFVDASGNVGIGDNNPAAKLHVEDNTNDTSPGSTALVRLESTGAGTDAGIRFKSGVSAYTQIGGIGGNLYAYTNGSEKLRITSAGLVGIGTSSPSGFIHIQGASTGTETYGRFTTGPANGDQSLVIKSGSSRDHMAIQVSTNAGAADDLALQPDGGNVGIGTSSPAYKCDIDVTGSAVRLNSTTSQALLVISSDDAANAKIEFGDESDNDRGAITYDNPNNALIFQANAAERLRIANTGAFGLSGANYGTSGQVLTSQGSGSAPQWVSAGYTSLGRTNTTSGASHTVTGIPTTARHVVIVFSNISVNTANTPQLTFQVGNGSLSTGDYYWSIAYGTNFQALNATSSVRVFHTDFNSPSNSYFGVIEIYPTDPYIIGYIQATVQGNQPSRGSFKWAGSSAIDRVNLSTASTFDAGHFVVYYI
jgi:hypothetical protein